MQNDLLDLGADLSVPAADGAERERLRITAEYTEWLEEACDEVNAKLPPLRSFVIPGGTPAAAHLHVCRTVCRRAERRALAVEDANPEVVRYLNRLSDLLFILARAVNQGAPTSRSPCGTRERTGRRRRPDRRRRHPGQEERPRPAGRHASGPGSSQARPSAATASETHSAASR